MQPQTAIADLFSGEVLNQPELEYHAIGAKDPSVVSSSRIKDFIKSPRSCFERIKNPIVQTTEMREGTTIHTAITEPELLFVTKATRKGTKEWNKDVEENPTKMVIKQAEYEMAMLARENLFKEADGLLDGMVYEASYFATCPKTGLYLKGRLDGVAMSNEIIDFKTVSSMPDNPEAYMFRYGFYIQAAFYMKLMKLVLGKEPSSFVFIMIERNPPYDFQVYECLPEFILYGEEQIEMVLPEYAKCLVNGVWPGYDKARRPLGLPEWMRG